MVALPQTFSLGAREVEVVVTLDRPLTGDFRFKKLVDFQFGVYAAATYFERRQRPASPEHLAAETWCGNIKELLFTSELDFRPCGAPGSNPRFRTTSVTVQLSAALGGYALALLPCFVAKPHPTLERILAHQLLFDPPTGSRSTRTWRKYPRVRAVIDAIEALVLRDRGLFMPKATRAVAAIPQPMRMPAPPTDPLPSPPASAMLVA